MKKSLSVAFSILSCGSLLACSAAYAEDKAHGGGMASCTQDLTPPKQIEMYLDGYHCRKKDIAVAAEKQVQFRAAHYCSHLPSGMFMCSVYDGNGPAAKLVAIEYVITDDKYEKLPASEKKYWHPHDEEVDTGLLTMPGLDAEKEKATLKFLRATHGKTWQVWPDPKQEFPLGEPVLLWSIDAKKINSQTKKSVEQRKTNPAF
jgi:hypothetical protein